MRLSARLNVAIKQLMVAEVANSWKGGGDPSDIPEIERRLAVAKRRVKDLISQVRALEARQTQE